MTTTRPGFPHTILDYLSRPPGYKKLMHIFGDQIEGTNLLEEDWDLCIVLDACRADLMRSVLENEWTPPQEATWDTITSVDSATEPWTKKTFVTSANLDVPQTDYVCANPFSVEAHGSPHIGSLDETWRYGWDTRLGTVPPSVVTDRTIEQYRAGDGRVIAHYIQPHMPPLRREGDEVRQWFEGGDSDSNSDTKRDVDQLGENWRHPESDRSSLLDKLPGQWDTPTSDATGVFQRLRYGDLDHATAWAAYRDTLLVALEEVTTLLRSVDAEKVVITSDHGNAFGEWGFFGHPMHMPFPVLREVPYITTSATVEIDYEPRTYETEDTSNRAEQLEALGYR